MFAGKSSSIINTYNKIWNKNNVLVFKPKIDTRDTTLIKSRDYQEVIKAVCFKCNKPASYTYYEYVLNGITIGNDKYYPLCECCLEKK